MLMILANSVAANMGLLRLNFALQRTYVCMCLHKQGCLSLQCIDMYGLALSQAVKYDT